MVQSPVIPEDSLRSQVQEMRKQGRLRLFFFAKNLSSLSLFLALVLGDLRVFLTSGESVESRMFRAFVASREKERDPTLTVIRKSMF